MEVHGPGGVSGPQRIELPRVQPQRPSELDAARQVRDRAEISEEARLLAKLAEVPGVRAERVEELRALIESGRYETPEKIAGAVEKILEEI